MFSVNNIFYTIQGEGKNIGKPSIFIRLSGCNLHCIWCDTEYTWLFSEKTRENLLDITPKDKIHHIGDEIYSQNDESEKFSLNELEDRISEYPCKHIVISGGEPLLQKTQIIELVDRLERKGFTFEIETNGTISPDGISKNVQFNVSPKLKNSYNTKERRYKPDILREFIEMDSIFKFVIEMPKDLEEVQNMINELQIPSDMIYLMPEGRSSESLKSKSKWIITYCKEYNYQFSYRLHVELFGDERGV